MGTLGTAANNSLTSLIYAHSMVAADLRTIANSILNDKTGNHAIWPGAYAENGLLHIPRRGVLRVFRGDYVGVDSAGWPILVSANSIANAAWTKT